MTLLSQALPAITLRNMPQDLPPAGGYDAVQYKVRYSIISLVQTEQGLPADNGKSTAQYPRSWPAACMVPRWSGLGNGIWMEEDILGQ
jgi:hypothetical protein